MFGGALYEDHSRRCIMDARSALAAKGVYCEHTTAAKYAAYLHYCEKYGPVSDCLITMCGAGLKSDH